MDEKPKFPETEHEANYADVAYRWAKDAASDTKGKFHGKWSRLAAKRHLEDLKLSEIEPDYPFEFDPWHANDICDFVETFPHVEGTWETPTLTLEPVQIFLLTTIFGWRKKSDGLRRFTSVYIEMARKGAKSTLTAPVALYCLTCEGEVGPQIIIGASTGDQAKKVFNPAKAMADKSPDFREHFGVETWARAISCKDTGGYIQTVNAKSSTQDGHNPHVGILDELHAHKDRGLYDVIRSAFGSRKNPLMWVITTAGYNINGVCYEQHKLVRQILDGLVQADHYFGIIFSIDEDDDELNPNCWIKANPMLGITPTVESMQSYAAEAAVSPGTMGEFRTKRLNVWTNAFDAWINLENWKRCAGEVVVADLEDWPAWGGLDLASTEDIAAFVLCWLKDGRLKVLPRLWCPEDTAKERTRRNNLPYRVWAEQRYLLTTPGNVIDHNFIVKDVKQMLDQFNVQKIGYDPWNATAVVTELQDEGAEMVQMRQGPKSFHPPMKELQKHIKARTLDHGGHPVLSWMAANVVARYDQNNNMAPDRKNSQEKIDGIVALLNGLGVALALDESVTNPYSNRAPIAV